MKTQFKITLYNPDGSYSKILNMKSINGFDSERYSNNIGGGQGEVDLKVMTNYDDLTLDQWQLVEISSYDEDYPSGLAQFTGFIKNVNRNYSQDDSDSVDIEILGIGSILWEYSGSFVMTGALNAVIDAFITSFNAQYSISNTMEFLGSTLIKNGITDTTSVTVNTTGTYFDMLVAIFAAITPTPKNFFIDSDWTIYLSDQSTTEHLITVNKDITNMVLSSSRETSMVISGNHPEMKPGDKISILNTNASFNLDWQRIQKVEVGLLDTNIYLGTIWSLASNIAWI